MDEVLVGPRLYSCSKCRSHVALHDDIVSKAFQVKLSVLLGFLLTHIMLKFKAEIHGFLNCDSSMGCEYIYVHG